jgi:predicted nucleic acid-binding Zn ribbon protein
VTSWRPLPEEEGARDPARLGPSLDRVAKRLGAPSAKALSGLFVRWADLVGDGIAAHATPVSLRRGVLLVEVDSNAWATQLRYMTTELVAKCCEELGDGAVKKIELRVARAR